MSEDENEAVELSAVLSDQLVAYIESHIEESDGILKAQLLSAPEVVNALGELAGVLEQGDEACYALVSLAGEADQLGFGCQSTNDADYLLMRAISGALEESHPTTSLLLMSLSPPYNLSDRFKARLIEDAKDLVARMEQMDQPGLVELNALLNFSEGLDLGVPPANTSREQVSLLCTAEALLTRLEAEGQTLPKERAHLSYVGRNYFNYGQKAIHKYKQFYTLAFDMHSDKERDEYQWIARERLNPLFKLMLEHSRAKNHVGETLSDMLDELTNLFERIQKGAVTKPTPWIFAGEGALLSAQPKNILKLALNTFQVTALTLMYSLKRQPGSTNLNWYDHSKKLVETDKIKALNLHFDATAHDPAERLAAFTNLLIVTVKLAKDDLEKTSERKNAEVALDDLFQQLVPHADLKAVSPELTEAENDLWAGYILRQHRHLHDLVPLKSIGNNFSAELGL